MSTETILAEDETDMPASSLDDFLDGARLCIPVIVASAPFAMLFGALAVANGLSVFETALMSATVFGGASQMVGIELFGQKIAPWLIVLSIFAVNFRHVLYSAAIGSRLAHWPVWQQAAGYFLLTDPQFALAEARAESGKSVGFAWYMGAAFPVAVSWIFCTWLGAMFGSLVPNPQALGLDFLLPIYFFGIVMGFRSRPLWLPIVLVSGVAAMLAYKFVGSPWHVSLGALAGIVLAVIVGPVKDKAAVQEGKR
ncbi:MAG TPA: AzlC family ABC transporter permease [Mesorhizobium sp.]